MYSPRPANNKILALFPATWLTKIAPTTIILMSQITQRIDNLGRREAATLATATTQKAFASTTAPSSRQAVSINNCDTSADLYVVLTAAGSSAPTISATDNDLIIAPKASRQLQIGTGIDVWVRHSGAGTINYTATELL
jgi:hypothetical protein